MTIAPDHLRQRWNCAPPFIQSILDEEKTQPPFVEIKRNPNLTYREQLGKDLHKATQDRHISATVYYTWLLEQNFCASAGYEQFRGSWAHSEWIHKPEVLSLYQAVIAEMNRFRFLR